MDEDVSTRATGRPPNRCHRWPGAGHVDQIGDGLGVEPGGRADIAEREPRPTVGAAVVQPQKVELQPHDPAPRPRGRQRAASSPRDASFLQMLGSAFKATSRSRAAHGNEAAEEHLLVSRRGRRARRRGQHGDRDVVGNELFIRTQKSATSGGPQARASTKSSPCCCWPRSSACPCARTPAASGCASTCSTSRCSTTCASRARNDDRMIEYAGHLHEHFVTAPRRARRAVHGARPTPGSVSR